MPSTIDSLLNQLMPVSSSRALTPSQQSAVINAVVLSNSPLLDSGDSPPQIRVTLSANRQTLELTAQLPLPVGSRVQLKITPDNLATILSLTPPPGSRSETAVGQPQQTLNNPLLGSSATVSNRTGFTQPAPPAVDAVTRAAPDNPLLTPDAQRTSPRQMIDQAIRQALPQQQPVRNLIPLIQTVLQQSPALPKPLTAALQQLVRQMPTPDQLQSPQPLKRALLNSGLFLESRLATRASDTTVPNRAPTPEPPAAPAKSPIPVDAPREILSRDTKALLEHILPQLQRLTGNRTSPENSAPLNAAPQTYSPGGEFALPLNTAAASSGQHHGSASHPNPSQSGVDVLLRQLGRQLMASLARTQLNQLDSLAHRQAVSNDPQSPVNSWHLEIPILNGHQVDNLDLRIEQQQAGEDPSGRDRKSAWSVMLNFDLHQLGKMQVQLVIVDQSVSATVWSQLEPTHRQVQQHLQELRRDLEKVGVAVKKVECQLGLAPDDRLARYRQLVDVHT